VTAYNPKKHGLCQSQLFKFINGLSDAKQEEKDIGLVFSRNLPVKFSSTIHGGAKKKKRPWRALFFAIFFIAAPYLLRRGMQAAGA
jgi:hypothetical protein